MFKQAITRTTVIFGVITCAVVLSIGGVALASSSSPASAWVCVSAHTAGKHYTETKDAPHACAAGYVLAGVGQNGATGSTGAAGPAGPAGSAGVTTAGPGGLDITRVSASSADGMSDALAVCPAGQPYVIGSGGTAPANGALQGIAPSEPETNEGNSTGEVLAWGTGGTIWAYALCTR
jgi:hypothetical protein